MEMMAFLICMNKIQERGLDVGTIITDRHTSIAKHMRTNLPQIKHYFDLWHLKKSKLSEIVGFILSCFIIVNLGGMVGGQ